MAVGAFVDSLKSDSSLPGNSVDGVTAQELEGWRNHATGSLGELITALIMVDRGWRQLPSQPNNGGIDGVFIRKLNDRSGGYEFCLVETKASTRGHSDALRNYDQDSNWLSDDQVRKKLDELQSRHEAPYLAEDIDDALRSALDRQPRYLTKKLFIHSYPDCETSIYSLDGVGARDEAPEETIADPEHLNLLEALEIGISRLARNVGVGSKVIGVINPKQVKMTPLWAPFNGPRLRNSERR